MVSGEGIGERGREELGVIFDDWRLRFPRE